MPKTIMHLDENDVGKLEYLMKRWNLDERATLQRCFSMETAKAIRERKAGKAEE
jgi:hypothetical protein